jgi:two-component system cell cycle response regulator
MLQRSAEEINVTVSAGVATFLGEDDTLANLLHRADTALYQAKQSGRNRVESVAA